MAAYLDCLPVDKIPEGFDLDSTINPEYKDGFLTTDDVVGMHYQGRRYGGSNDAYNTNTTFKSYFLNFNATVDDMKMLREVVPEDHKKFLREMSWIVDKKVSWYPYRVICVHAGLTNS